jgi:hypothetical protein
VQCPSTARAPTTSALLRGLVDVHIQIEGPAKALALYQIVHDHFEAFRAQAASLRDGEGLPRFVEHAFRTFLPCGLAGGLARMRCGGGVAVIQDRIAVTFLVGTCPRRTHQDVDPIRPAHQRRPSTAQARGA